MGQNLVEFAMPELGTFVHTHVITPEAVAAAE